MKLFIRNILKFCAVLISIWILHILFLIVVSQMKPAKYALYYNNVVIQHKKYFILGDSHSQCALNDSLLGDEYLNLSKSAEPLFYTAIKAQNIIDQLKPDTLIIQLNNTALASIQWALGNNRLVENYRDYFSLMSLRDHQFLFQHNFLKSLKAVAFLTLRDVNNYRNMDGYYQYLPAVKNNDTLIVNEDNKPNAIAKYYRVQNKNLEALTDLISKNPTTTFFIFRTPLKSRVKLYHESEYQQYVNSLKRFSNCFYYDFHTQVSLPDSCFYDLQHLNYKGARVFSPLFKKAFKK